MTLHITTASHAAQTDAFEAARGRAAAVRADALTVLRRRGPSTADEIANALGLSVLSVRPRVTDLKRLKLIVETGERRKTASGATAAVYRVA